MILNENMNDIIKIVKLLENLSVLIGGIIKTVKNKTKEQR